MTKQPQKSRLFLKINLISIFIYTIVFTLFIPFVAHADFLYSPTYLIEMSSINMGAGTATSSAYSLNTTLGQTIQGLFGTSGFLVKAGFQYIHPLIPFTFRISNLNIDFGSLVPGTPSTKTNTLTVTTGSAHGYSVNTIEDHALRLVDGTATIPNTSCDLSLTCSTLVASPWTDNGRYGFGYNIQGTDVNTLVFVNNTYYRPFPMENVDTPVTIMQRNGVATDSSATVTYKINIDGTQASGVYQNSIQYLAIPSF